MNRPPPRSTLFPYTTLFRSFRHRQVPVLRAVVATRHARAQGRRAGRERRVREGRDRKSTRLNSSHTVISYAVFCLKKKKKNIADYRKHKSEDRTGKARPTVY